MKKLLLGLMLLVSVSTFANWKINYKTNAFGDIDKSVIASISTIDTNDREFKVYADGRIGGSVDVWSWYYENKKYNMQVREENGKITNWKFKQVTTDIEGYNFFALSKINNEKLFYYFIDQIKSSKVIKVATIGFGKSKTDVITVNCMGFTKAYNKMMMVNDKKLQIKNGEIITYYKNGKIKIKVIYKDGKRNGEMIAYYKNGKIEQKGNCKDGKQNGEWIYYYENGKIAQKGNYKDGLGNGEMIPYYENGKIKEKETFKDGEKIG